MAAITALDALHNHVRAAARDTDRRISHVRNQFATTRRTVSKVGRRSTTTRNVGTALGRTAAAAAVVAGAIVACKGALWIATGTLDNAEAIKNSTGALYRRIFGNRATSEIRAALENLSTAVVPSDEEEREEQALADELSRPDPAGELRWGALPDAAYLPTAPGASAASAAQPGPNQQHDRQGDQDASAGGGSSAPTGARATGAGEVGTSAVPVKRRRPGKIVAEFTVRGRKYALSGFWARLAFDAKERFRSVEYSTYNQAALSRWLDLKLRDAGEVRYQDRRANLGLVELFVWYVDDSEKALKDAFEELKAMGRIRTRVD